MNRNEQELYGRTLGNTKALPQIDDAIKKAQEAIEKSNQIKRRGNALLSRIDQILQQGKRKAL